MNILKIIITCLMVLFLAFGAFIFFKIHKENVEFQQKTVLALDTRRALEHLMLDLFEARKNSILDAPADGQWHNRIAFTNGRQGAMEYLIKDRHLWRTNKGNTLLIADHIGDFRIRRQKDSPDVLEIQIEAQNGASLVSNLKMRIRQ